MTESSDASERQQQLCSCGCGAVIDLAAPTFWNGIPVASVHGTAIVADAPEFPLYWAKREGIIGQRIPVVMVNLDGANYGGGITYLDNRDEEGWRKVAYGHGSPRYRHKDVSIEPGSFVPDDPHLRVSTPAQPRATESEEDADE